ncbi:MAG TPA: hypothetical protein VHA33_08750 [Candidatus Angelobacter sp.]|jgi:hypothetical protein|nr:hypothetical protein [Candidatus Angelobacter sp.]
MKAGLIPVLFDVVCPEGLASPLIQRVKGSGARSNENRIACDRRRLRKSAVRLSLPND